MMTEAEYILIRNLANVTNALNILRDTMPGDGVVTNEGRQRIISQLAEWQTEAHKKIKISDQKARRIQAD